MDEIPGQSNLPSRPTPAGDPAPYLFDMPERPDLVAMVKKGVHRFTGERISRDQELCRAIMGDVILGMSSRSIAAKYNVSRNSIIQITRLMRESGEIESVKNAILADLTDLVTIGLEVWKEALLTGKIAPSQIPIPILAALDKKTQLEAGIVLGTGRTEKEITADDLKSAFEAMTAKSAVIDVSAPAGSRPADSQSAVKPTIPEETRVSAGSVAALDVDQVIPGPGSASNPLESVKDSDLSFPKPSSSDSDSGQGGGGGSASPTEGGG